MSTMTTTPESPTDRSRVRYELDDALALLESVRRDLRDLNGREIDVDGDSAEARRNRPVAAERGRTLLRSMDLIAAAGAEVGVQYWRSRGHEDPREQAAPARRGRA
jgi:hypothetical protein